MNVPLFLEIKNEYTEHLVDVLTPYIYEGLTSIYKHASRIAEETNKQGSTLMIFQKLLQGIDAWNQNKIDEETNRIKQASNTSDYLDDLVKAVIKSNIILLTYSNTISNLVAQSFYNSFRTATFIHRCYTECGKDAHNKPYLFYYDPEEPMEYKRNQVIIHQQIETGIVRAIRKILPISIILKEYLVNSINIINEPAKIELMNEEPKLSYDQMPVVDPQLEKEVMKIIKSESVKSDKQKIQAIMNIDKLITSMEPVQPAEINISEKKPLSTKKSDILIAPLLMEKEEDHNLIPMELNRSEKNLLNMNFDKEPTIEGTNRTVQCTTLTGMRIPSRYNPLTSERIDPSNIDLIEDYGSKKSLRKTKRF